MARVTRQIRIDAPREKVWEALGDFGNIYKWNPGITRSRLTSEQTKGIGATRRCDLPSGYVAERIMAWREGQHMVIDIYETSLPLKRNVVELAVREDGNGTTVTVTPDYAFRYGPLGALLDVLFGRRQIERGFDGLLQGLKRYVETGEEVERPELARARA